MSQISKILVLNLKIFKDYFGGLIFFCRNFEFFFIICMLQN